MAGYTVRDIEWVRGTTPRLVYRFSKKNDAGERAPLQFDAAILSVFNGSALAFRVAMPITDAETGEVQVTLTAAQSRMVKESKVGEPGKGKYEIELRNGGDERVYVMGAVAGVGGLNSDEGAE